MKQKIAFDFDGVIADTTIKKKEWLLEKKNIDLDFVDKTSFFESLSEQFQLSTIENLYQQMSKDIFTREVLMNTKPINKSLDVIKKIAKRYDVYIITSRPIFMLNDVRDWFKKYKIDTFITKIISSSNQSKQDICLKEKIDALCDDDIRHLKNRKIKRLLYFNQNKKLKIENILIVSTWNDIYNIFM